MTDDPHRARCDRCHMFMAKEREHEPGICYLCSVSKSGIWQPTPIARHRYTPKTATTAREMRRFDGDER